MAVIDFKGSRRKDLQAIATLIFADILTKAFYVEVVFFYKAAAGCLVIFAGFNGTFFWREAHAQTNYANLRSPFICAQFAFERTEIRKMEQYRRFRLFFLRGWTLWGISF